MGGVAGVMAGLKKKGSEKMRAMYARHGMKTENVYGVSIADLKVIAKTIKGEQALACELYATGNLDAMYLAGMVADGTKMTKKELNEWAEGAAGLQMISEYTVAWVAVENADGRELALKWMKSKNEQVAASGWSTYAGILATKPDEELDLAEIEELAGGGGQRNWRGEESRAAHDELFCDRGGELCEAVVEEGEGGGERDWDGVGGYGRYGVQSAVCGGVH